MKFSYSKITPLVVILCVMPSLNGFAKYTRGKTLSGALDRASKSIGEATDADPRGVDVVGGVSALAHLSVDANMSFLNFFKQLQDINKAVKELTSRTDLAVKNIDSKMEQLSKTASAIPSTNPQDVVKNSFSTIDGMFDASIELLPVIKEFADLLSVISTKLVTAASIIDIEPDKKLTADASTVSSSLDTASKKVTKVKDALDQWITKVRALSATIGKEAVIPAEKLNAVTDEIKKTFGAALDDLKKYPAGQ